MGFQDDYNLHTINAELELYFKILYGIKPERIKQIEAGLLATDTVYPKIKTFIKDRKINEAEDLIFEYADESYPAMLDAGLVFYHQINGMSDEELEAAGYTREEILDGAKELLAIYGQDELVIR